MRLLHTLYLGLLAPLAFSEGILRAQNYDSLMRAHGLIEVQLAAPRIQVQLKYATRDNFAGANMYGSLRKAYLHPNLAQALARAQELLPAP